MIKVRVDDGKAYLTTPYSKEFVTRIKTIGGAKWSGSEWVIPEASLGYAREIMIEVYGETDQKPGETVDLRVTFTEEMHAYGCGVELFSKTVAYAHGRDSGARPGAGVDVISGRISSGGSMKNWMTIVNSGTVIIMHEVSKLLYDKYLDAPDQKITVEVVERGENDKKRVLLQERSELMARIAEIDALLEAM